MPKLKEGRLRQLYSPDGNDWYWYLIPMSVVEEFDIQYCSYADEIDEERERDKFFVMIDRWDEYSQFNIENLRVIIEPESNEGLESKSVTRRKALQQK